MAQDWLQNAPVVDADQKPAQAAAPQPSGLGVAATAGHTAMSAMAGFGSPLQAAIGAYGNLGKALEAHTPLDIPGWQAAQQFNERQNQYRAGLAKGAHGFAEAGNMAGEMASQIGLGKLLPTSRIVTPIEEAPTMGAQSANAAVRSIGRVGSSTLKGVATAIPYGTQAGLTTPLQNGETYGQHTSQNVQGAMQMGAAIPGGLSLLGEAGGAAKAGANIGMKRLYGTQNVAIAPEVTHGESVREVLAHAATDPDLSQDQTISDIQRRSQGEQTQPDTQKAKATIQRLTAAAAAEHGVDLSLGDLSGDPQLRVQEQALESKPGSVMNRFRAKQGSQLRSAVMNLGSDADMATHSQPFQFEHQPSAGLPTDLTEPVPTLDLAVRDAQRARQNGQIGSNLTEPEIIAKKISDMEQNPSNPRAIQLSLEGQHWQNRQIDAQNHTEINDAITGSLEHNPDLPKTVDVNPVVNKLDDLIRQNRKSPAYSSELDSQLNAYRTNLTGGEVKDLSYDNVHHAVSSMERTIADLKEGGNRNLVQNLQQVKNLLDFQKEKFATQTLADQPDMLGKIRAASDFHKDNVVPYQDPDHGITQIIRGTDADKAVRPLFTDSSPDEFARIFGKLDPKGQQAVRAELIGRTEDSASRMKNFQDINLPGFARYLENRADQVHTAYGDDSTLSGLANLIRNTPRAGYQSKLENLFNINSAAGIGAKGVGAIGGYAVGGPVGAGVGTALEMGGELAANRAVSTHLTNPANVANYLSGDIPKLGSQLEQAPVRYAAGEVPPRSLGAAGQRLGEPQTHPVFQSPQPNAQFTMEGRAGTAMPNPYEDLEAAQRTHQANQYETRTAWNNATQAMGARRTLGTQLDEAQQAQQLALQRSGGTNPQGWEGIERGDRFPATDQYGSQISPRNPFETEINNRSSAELNRMEIKKLQAPMSQQNQIVRNPTADEARTVADRIDNYLQYLDAHKGGELPTILDPGHRNMFRPMTPDEVPGEVSNMNAVKKQILDYADRVEKGQTPTIPAQMSAINDLAEASSKVQQLQKAVDEMRSSKLNIPALVSELADARDAEADSFQRVRAQAPNLRKPVPANNPNTAIPSQTLTGQLTEPGQIANPRSATQTGTIGAVGQPRNTMSEPFANPVSGRGPSRFGPNSVGAAEDPFAAAQRAADAANRGLQNAQRGVIPSGAGNPPQSPLEAAQAAQDATREQYRKIQNQLPGPASQQTPPAELLRPRTQPDLAPTGLKAKMLAMLGLHPSQTEAPLSPGGTALPKGSSEADKLAQQLIDEHPEMREIYRPGSVQDLSAETGKSYTTAEQNQEAAKLLSKREGKPIESYLNVPEPNSPADVGAAKNFTQMFDEETKNLRTQHEKDAQTALASGATPSQIQNLRNQQAQIVKDRVEWNQIAKRLAQKGSDEEWALHMKRMPR